MYQIDVSSVASTQPTSTALGTTGYFTDGNAATGLEATVVPAEFLNSVMLELINAITGAGLELSKDTFNQLYTAISKVAADASAAATRQSGSFSGYTVESESAVVLTEVDVGRVVELPSIVGYCTVPTIAVTEPGDRVYLVSTSSAAQTYYGSFLLDGVTYESLSAQGHDTLEIVQDGTHWKIIGGTIWNRLSSVVTATSDSIALAQVQTNSATFAAGGGTANAHTVTLSPAPTAYTDGMVVRWRAGATNTDAATLAANGLTAYPIQGAASKALAAGEIVSGGYYEAVFNSSSDVFILKTNTGGPLQVPSATASDHAVNLGQFGASFGSGTGSGYQKLPGGLIIQWGFFNVSYDTSNTFFYQSTTFPVTFPNTYLTCVGSLSGGNVSNAFSNLSLEEITNSGFEAIYTNGSGATTAAVRYIAIGY